MKKKLALAMIVVTMMFAFAACGGKDLSNSPFVGTWVATTAEYSGFEMSVSSIMGGDVTLTLEGNGKGTMSLAGQEDSVSWDETENGFSVDGVEITVQDGVASMDYEGMILKFQQQ